MPARVELLVHTSKSAALMDSNGATVTIPFLRLVSWIYPGSRAGSRLAIVDTAAPLSVFTEPEWQPVAGDIEWLHPAPGQTPPQWLTQVSGLGGGNYACRLGRIRVAVTDRTRVVRLPAVDVLAYFLSDGGRFGRILMGLHGGILEGRRLVVEPDLRQAWIEER